MKPSPHEATPLSAILQDLDASEELHKFLLGSFDEKRERNIRVGPDPKFFKVEIINLNLAPPIPRKNNKHKR